MGTGEISSIPVNALDEFGACDEFVKPYLFLPLRLRRRRVRTEAIHFVIYSLEIWIDVPKAACLLSAAGYDDKKQLKVELEFEGRIKCVHTSVCFRDEEKNKPAVRDEILDVDIFVLFILQSECRK